MRNHEKGLITLKLSTQDYQKLINTSIGKDIYLDVPNRKEITVQQRKAVYALFGDIAQHLGYEKEEIKNILKVKYTGATGAKPFSLSDMKRDEATEFVHFCMDLCIKLDIPIKLTTYKEITKDDYIIKQLLLHRSCVICGKHSDIHHLDTVGMGNNRNHVDNTQQELLPLCRKHHELYHQLGHDTFMNKFHLDHGVKLTHEELKQIGLH